MPMRIFISWGWRMASLSTQLAGIVGKENLAEDPATLDLYARDSSFAEPIRPRYVVKVKDADQVQRIVKLANETKTPIVPVSSTGPRHNGDTVPSVPESIIVDLSGMKRIISINRQQRVVIVEPGVTYGELQPALAAEGLTLSLPLATKAGKSVVASVLDLEPRLNALHQWNFIDPLRCTEVIWGDGNRMYTGEAGGGPLDVEKQQAGERWQVSGTGPMMLDFYRLLTGSQGSMGIVTWASLKCDVLSPERDLCVVPAEKAEDLVDFLYRVTRLRLGAEALLVNAATLASLLGKDPAEISALVRSLPAWMALIGINGQSILPEMRAAAHIADIGEIAQQFGLRMVDSLPGIPGKRILEKLTEPSGKVFWKDCLKGTSASLFFTTTLDSAADYISTVQGLAAAQGWNPAEIGVYVQPQNMGTSIQLEFIIPYNSADRVEADRAKRLFTEASVACARKGAYFLRPHGIWAALQLNKDVQSAALLRRMKGVFDPNNIMNTGKLGLQGA